MGNITFMDIDFYTIPDWSEYMVSICGKVYSIKTQRILSSHVNRSGYEIVVFCVNGKTKVKTVHSLVAETFIGKRPDGFHINHIDYNRINNNLINLEYVTPKQNSEHSKINRKHKPIFEYNQNGAFVKEYFSVNEAAREIGVNDNAIREILRGNTHSVKGRFFSVEKVSYLNIDKTHCGRSVLVYNIDGSFLKEFQRIKDAAIFCGTHITTISACCRGRKKSAKGYTFKYTN